MQFINVVGGQLLVTPQAREKLLGEWQYKELAVVSIVGRYRQGKSYLANAIAEEQCFQTSDSVNAETRGVWFSPRLVNDRVLIMDTEGLGSTDASANHDMHIFSIVVFLSSTVLLNHMGPIDANILETLRIAGKVSEGLRNHHSNQLCPPKLLMILRDMSLQLVDRNGSRLTPDEYFERKLTDLDTKLAANLKELFPHRNLIALPRPTNADHDLRHMRNLRPEFLEKVDGIVHDVAATPVREVGNQLRLNGALLLAITESVLSAINQGAVPEVKDMWESMMEVKRLTEAVKLGRELQQVRDALVVDCVPAAVSAWFQQVDRLQWPDDMRYHDISKLVVPSLLSMIDSTDLRWYQTQQCMIDQFCLDHLNGESTDIDAMAIDAVAKYALKAGTLKIGSKKQVELLETRIRTMEADWSKQSASAEQTHRETLQREQARQMAMAADLELQRSMAEQREAEQLAQRTLDGQEVLRLREELADCRERLIGLDGGQAEMSAAVITKTNELLTCRHELSELLSQKYGLDHEVKSLMGSLTDAKRAISEQSACRDAMKDQLAKANLRIIQCTEQMELLQADKRQLVGDIEERDGTLAAEKRKSADTTRDLTKQLRDCETNVAVLNNEVSRKRQRENDYVAARSTTIALQTEVKWLSERHDVNMKNIAELKSALAEAQRNLRTAELSHIINHTFS